MNSTHKRTLAALLAGVALTLPAAAQEDGLVIGHAAAVTGLLAPYDGPDGVACRVAQINDAGGILGKPVTLLTRDTKSDPVTAANIAQELIDAGADVLFGPPTDDGLIPMAGLALGQGMAVLSVGSTQPAFPQASPENGYLVPYGDNASGAAAAELAYAAGHRKAALMIAHDVGAYSLVTPEYFAQAFEKLGGKIVGRVAYHHGLADYTPQVTEISNMAEKPDVIFGAILVPDAGVFLRTLASADVNIPVYGTDGFDDPSLIPVSGEGGKLATFITHGFPSEGSALKAFYEDCAARGFNVQNIFFGLGGEAVDVVKTAVEAAGSFEPAAINAAIREIQGMKGIASGSITYKDQNGTPLKEMVALQIKDGAFVEVARPTPAWVPAP
ncbi:MAG: ABC transporter substrate-binding protein [Albidovulum sp.]|uniref:ABC transporter substrate-binding protein n=1 Tax=Albidovulum sp. TaxID=1872424 RepID=UPI001328285F|nr:ABC transporter substrate-binding protein [Defluviimonas sp.]KAB2886517.1 MAG: ABC transporter substrate-binding protein [Defluviimonas sp.]